MVLNRTFMICASLVVAVSIWSGNAPPAAADIRFDARLVRMAYETPVWATPGDFNGDTIIDAVVASRNNDSVYLMVGNGDGTFGGSMPLYVTANEPTQVAAVAAGLF
jgi:hypothetical protein